MMSIVYRIPLVVATAVLLSAMTALMFCQPNTCDPSCVLTSPSHAAVNAAGPTPTLAPPQKMVVVRVEVDKPDLQIGWVEGN
jgi:hypothetical protein